MRERTQLFYDARGRPSGRELLSADIAERRVALTKGLRWHGRPAEVSTVLLPGVWYMNGPESDLPFETAVMVGGEPVKERRWATRFNAVLGHEVIVATMHHKQRARMREIHSAYSRRRGRGRW